ncbi:MAG: hypothetical protein ABSE16_01585 [Verrucomicrobiota bacterium]|jgi:hypothetical protein
MKPALAMLLILCGCASQPTSSALTTAAVPPEVMPAGMSVSASAAPSANIASGPAPAPFTLPDFVYPAGITNAVWWLQMSTNLVDWSFTGDYFTGWPPTGSLAITGNLPHAYYRLFAWGNLPCPNLSP